MVIHHPVNNDGHRLPQDFCSPEFPAAADVSVPGGAAV
jgi:hypothetical protein